MKGNNDIIILDDGFTALHLCCIHGHIECVRALVDNNYDINASHSFTGVTPLHLACQKGFLDILKFLLASKKCDIQKVCKHGNNCLHYAVEANHKEVFIFSLILLIILIDFRLQLILLKMGQVSNKNQLLVEIQ